MTIPSFISQLGSVITIGIAFAFFRILLGWLDRRIVAKVMKERINAGSDRFFKEDEKHWGESEIDTIVRGRFDDV